MSDDDATLDDGPRRKNASNGLLERLVRAFSGAENREGSDDALDEGQREAIQRLPRARREMIERVIAFDEKRVVDVMAPRADIIAVEIELGLDELLKAFADAGHSRLPVFRGDLDDPLGMVHIKDLVQAIAGPAAQNDAPPLRSLLREVLYVPPSMRVTDLLLRMQASRIHMALVIDEFGGTDGLVTIEDLVEEIVGDINDEHDEDESPSIMPRPSGGWDVDARVELDAFQHSTGITLAVEEEEIDTVGGLVIWLAGRVPQRGEILSHAGGYELEVTEADARKVRRLIVQKRSVGAAGSTTLTSAKAAE